MQRTTVDHDHSGLDANIDRAVDGLLRPHLSVRVSRRVSLREVAETLFIVIVLYCIINLATARYVVEGASMEPTFHSDQLVVVSRLAYLLSSPERGDVIVFHNPERPSEDFIKRVVGLPGEVIEIKNGQVYVNGIRLEEPYIVEHCQDRRCDGTWTLDPEHYFVLGDNRNHSRDGHNFGPLDRSLIIGQAWIRYWPLQDWSIVMHPDFGVLGKTSPAPP